MKVFISCDMEGIAGIVDWAQCRPDGGAAYERGCELMLAEVNAAVQGALAGGATELVVNDSHGAMANLDPAALKPPTSYLSGRHKPGYMMQGLDSSFDAVFFVGYHGSISGEPSVLSHTYNPEVISGVRLGGEYVGESGINALVAHAHGVPIALITGDTVTISEARSFAPDHVGVVVKESLTRFAAHHVHPVTARLRIMRAATEAMRAVKGRRMSPPVLTDDLTLEVDLQTADMAAVASWVKGVERSGTRSVRVTGAGPDPDGQAVYDAFVALTYITRQAGGR
ncbi:MAG: M55 family metallopeptidase [Nocardioidaceae bacterium]